MSFWESLQVAWLENFWYIIVFWQGAIVGSFLNVVIYRMPLGMSVSHPKSHCPNCNTYLGFWDNIPLLAFLFLRARCRYCRVPISWRYFCVELLTASLWTALFHLVSGDHPITWLSFVVQALFASVLVAVIFIDLDHFIIPDELNWVGVGLGLGRDIGCLALAWLSGEYVWKMASPHFAYFGFLPRAIPGALLYGGLLFLVSFIGYVVYAREEGESLGAVARRFFTYEEEQADEAPEASSPAAPLGGSSSSSEAGMVSFPSPPPSEGETPDRGEEETSTTAPVGNDEQEDEEGDAVRLRFSPAFLAFVSALILAPVARFWASLAFLIPLFAFPLISRQPGESFGAAMGRFFRANDQPAAVEEPVPPIIQPAAADAIMPEARETAVTEGRSIAASETATEAPAAAPSVVEQDTPPLTASQIQAMMAAEADEFARETESGKHGVMGLGDVKLALAIGAILGPGMALLSLFVATASGAVTGILLARLHGKNLRLGVPFGPFMALGAIIVMLFGDVIIDWYLRTMGMR